MHTTVRARNALQVSDISIAYGNKLAVKGVSFRVRRRSVHALIGPNGSGKSSIINAILGINQPITGTVHAVGYDMYDTATNVTQVRQKLGVIPDEDELVELLTGEEYIRLSAALYDVAPDHVSGRINELAKLFGMQKAVVERIGSYSHGMRKKLAFMAVMVAKPNVFIIDEPTNGLDPDVIILVRDIITILRDSGASILIATHNLTFAESIADDVTMLRGHVLASGSLTDVLQTARANDLEQAYLNLSGMSRQHETIKSYLAHS